MKQHHLISIAAAIAALTVSACTTPQVASNATPADKSAAKAAAIQADFDRACTYANGAIGVAGPLVPVIAPKLGESGTLAVQSLIAAVKTTCGKPLDVNNADAIVQNVYDIGGQVIAIVLKSQQS